MGNDSYWINPMPILVWCLGDGLEWFMPLWVGCPLIVSSTFAICLTCWTAWPFIWKQKTSRLLNFWVGQISLIPLAQSHEILK